MMICKRCGKEFDRPHTSGRLPEYCSASCKQRAWEERERQRVFHAGFWVGAYEYGAGGGEVSEEEVAALYRDWCDADGAGQ